MNRSAPPRGHTSIYFCPWIVDNWSMFAQYMTVKGHSSFNQYANVTIVNDVQKNIADVLGSNPFRKSEIRWDFYQPVPKSTKSLTVNYTDGQVLDLLGLTNRWRNAFIMDLKSRGCKL